MKIKLQDQPFQVLAVLLEHAGEIVTREQLRQKLWPKDTFVDVDNSVNAAINRLREALRDSAESPRFVETLPRRGYRFVAPVTAAWTPDRGSGFGNAPSELAPTELPVSSKAKGVAEPPAPVIRKEARSRRLIVLLGIVAVTVILTIARVKDRSGVKS